MSFAALPGLLGSLIPGLLLLAAGIALRILVGRNRFNRTNADGVQQFKNYRSLFGAQVSEGALILISTVLLTVGVFLTMFELWTAVQVLTRAGGVV